jgi:hypothetical protein
MPSENETRPCTYPKCMGTQTFQRNANIAGSNYIITAKDGTHGYPVPKPALAWLCDNDRKHYEIPSAS